MITRINAKNALDYQKLFEKATKVIKDNEAIALPENMTWDDFSISSLNLYYAYLKDIIDVFPETDIVSKAFYLRLPLDEDFLSINADTRTITVPSSFSRYGIGVLGDELAEILYFKIDRYFDRIDLANDTVKIAILWEARDANKQTIKGFTSNFGKDIETEPGSIIFGWPISGELTQTNGTIKFAVRFYSIGTDKEDDNKSIFTYSFMTLPAEITINSTLDYNLLENAADELDYGKTILSRINNSGIYDPSLPIPEEPIITTHLFAQNNTGNIVDLPTDGSGVKLAIAAHPETNGVVVYNWQKFAYNTETSNYNNQAGELPASDSIIIDYIEETEDIPVDTTTWYYKKYDDVYELVSLSNYEQEGNVYAHSSQGFLLNDGSYTYEKLYKLYSIATVHSVGKYGVEVAAKVLTNTTAVTDTNIITIPGPLKPNVSKDNHHILSENGEGVSLSIAATAGEEGKSASEVGVNPLVDLTYSWKRVTEDGEYVDAIANTSRMPVSILPAANLPTDSAWLENTNNGEKGIFNQEHSTVIQAGNTVTVYVSEELESYDSTDENQGNHKWLALDIDTGESSIVGLTWNDNYTFTEADENELGVADGHILFWFKADGEESVTRKINDTTLTFLVIKGTPALPYYNADKTVLTIPQLAEEELDVSYVAEVTATRNDISTSDKSGVYRITNPPVKPKIFIREYSALNGRFENVLVDYEVKPYSRLNNRTQNKTLSFSVEPPKNSDALSYIWMRLRADDPAVVPTDWENNAEKLQVDLIDALEEVQAKLGANPAGEPDYPVEEEVLKALSNLSNIGDPTDENFKENGPTYTLKDTDPNGIYYCVVVNELNGNIKANVSPFFNVY